MLKLFIQKLIRQLPNEFEQNLQIVYEKTNNIKNGLLEVPKHIADISSFLESDKTKIDVLIIKNSKIINLYRNYILSFFKNKIIEDAREDKSVSLLKNTNISLSRKSSKAFEI